MSEFDERFADRVREVFDAYEEPVDEGAWLLMQQRLAAERPSTLKLWAPWLMRAAAAVLLLVGGIWLWPRPEAHETAVLAQAPIPQVEQVEVEERVADIEIAVVSRDVPVPSRRQIPFSEPELPVFEGEAPPAPEEKTLPAERPDNDPVAPLFTRTVEVAQEPAIPPKTNRPQAGLHIMAAAVAPIADGRWASGSGGMVGVAKTWPLSERLHLTAGGGLSWFDASYAPDGLSGEEVVVTVSQGQTAVTGVRRGVSTVGVEVPLLLGVDLSRSSSGTFRVQGGLLSTLYVKQTFTEAGTRISGETTVSTTSGEPVWVLSRQPFKDREEVGVMQGAEIGRQLHLGAGYAFPFGSHTLGIDVFVRRSLGGMTSRNLSLDAAGITVRYGF